MIFEPQTKYRIASSEQSTNAVYAKWRENFATPLLIGTLIFGLFALMPAISSAGSSPISVIYIATYVFTLMVAILPLNYNLKMGAFLGIIYVLSLSELARYGILSDSLFFAFALVVAGTMLFSPEVGIATIVLNLLTYMVLGIMQATGNFAPISPDSINANLSDWGSAAGVILMFGFLVVYGFRKLRDEFSQAQNQINQYIAQINDERNNLEKRVQARTLQLQKVNEIGRALASTLEPSKLISMAVGLAGEIFDSYYTAIYLLDATGQWAEISQATGEAGRVLKENRHKVDVRGKSPIAQAIQTRKVEVEQGRGNSIYTDNPLLPYTRSQIALPLIVGEKVLGCLEIHSTREEAFSQQDIDTLQNLANEISVSLENAYLYQEMQQSALEMQATQRQYLEGAWSSLASEQNLEYEIGEPDPDKQTVDIDLSLRDQKIGEIIIAAGNDWSQERQQLLESIATQATLALENARLVEESQSIATRERLANEIIAKVWASTSMDTILQTTVRELGRVLDASEVEIQVSLEDSNVNE